MSRGLKRTVVAASVVALGASSVFGSRALLVYRADLAEIRLQESVQVVYVRSDDPFDAFRHVTFNVCNRGRDTVTSVGWEPQAMEAGRSTKYDFSGAERPDSRDRTRFFTDTILPPGACALVTSDGSFNTRDSVIVKRVVVNLGFGWWPYER